MILSPTGEVAAVVDWELCTLGDPLADVGLLLVYWSEAGDDFMPLFAPATIAPGFPTRDEVKRRYAERSGRDLSQIDFFVALGYWKLAIILEGVYARYAAGQYGKTDEGFEEFAKIVERFAEAADEADAGWVLGLGQVAAAYAGPRAEPPRRRLAVGPWRARPWACRLRRVAPAACLPSASSASPRRLSSRRAITILWTSSGPSATLEHAHEAPHPGERGVVGHPEGAVDLDRPVEHVHDDVRRHHLDHRDRLASAALALGVHLPGGVEGQQPGLVDLHPRGWR